MKLKPLFLSLSLASALAVTGCSSISSKQTVDYQIQKQVSELVQTGIHYYWHGGDLKKVEQEFFEVGRCAATFRPCKTEFFC